MDEFDNISNHFIFHQNKKLDLCCYKLFFSIEVNTKFIQSVKSDYQLSLDDINNMKSYLLGCFEYFKSRGYKFCNINPITIDIICGKCNMTYEYYINRPMQAFEMKLNVLIAKKPELIKLFSGSKDHPLL